MRRYLATLYRYEEVGKNKLGTPIIEEVESGFCALRQAPVSPILEAIEGNNAHIVTRSFLTHKPMADFARVTSFEFRGRRYRLTDISESMIGTIITGNYSKPGVVYEV